MAAKQRKRWKYWIIGLVVIIAAVLVIRHQRTADDKPIIRTAVVEQGTVTATVSANGVLQPVTTVQVKSNVAGQIVKLAVDEGDRVKPGQLIAKIDPTDTLTALEQNQADLAASVSKVDQAKQQLAMQVQQDAAQVQSAREALGGARAKLQQAQDQARVQPTLTSSAITQARSNYAAAQSALRQTKTALIPQKLASAKSAYDQARATLSTSGKDLARQKELFDKGFVSASVVELSQEKYDVAQAQVDTTKNKLDTIKDETDQDLLSAQAKADQAKAELDNAVANSVQNKLKQQDVTSAGAAVRQAEAALQVALAGLRQDRIKAGDIVQANAQVKRSQASVKNAVTQLGYTTVVAPSAGIVTKKYVEVGSIVTAGKSSVAGSGSGVAIVDIADISRMYALVDVDETDIGQIQVGQDVDVTVEAYPDELFTGKVTKIAPQSVVDQNVTTIPVTVEIDIPDQRLKPGMNVTCDFVTGRKSDVVMVPNEAVKDTDNGSMVTLLDGDKQVLRTVEVGLVGKDYTEIKRGLRPGDKVVTAVIEPTGTSNGTGMRPGGVGGPGGFGGPGGGMRGGGR